MTQGTPVERVTSLLTTAGYRPLSMPLIIGSVPFEFAAALLGPDRAPDLVLVVDTIDEREGRVRQKITALSRALDVIGSRRPLTAILTGPRPQTSTIEALGRVCRVLPVGTPVGTAADATLHDSLAVLLPLRLPEPTDSVADPMGELSRQMPTEIDPMVKEAVLLHASQGSKAVEGALRAMLSEVLPEEPEEGR
jgi:hypothetical protein